MAKSITIKEDSLRAIRESMVGSSNTASHNTVCVTEAAPEVDEFELGQESDNPLVGGNYCHVNESKYDIISLAIERYGLTNNLNQAGYILPNGSLLNFGKDGYREEDHRGIEGIYKSNNIPIWSNEYRYNYVVDFMNHGAIRCCLNGGILDMTKEPTAQQYSIIKAFVRNAVDIDIDFTDDKGNTLHSVSYMDAKPSQVVGDIYRYYNEGIKPIGNVHYESKDRVKELMESIAFDEHGMSLNNEKILGKYNLKDLILSKNGNYVTLNKIVANELGNGFGSKFMSDLVRIADKNGWTLALTPDMSFGASSVGRLKKFYKRFGFIPNKGRKADFNTRETMIRKPITENINFEVNSSDIDLSSFRKRDQLAPIWNEEGELNPRIRLKLLDIADDFWEFVNLKWVKPNGIILTGSICNFNWSQYSDIDLHLIVDFDEIDEKTEFVRDYLDAKKNEWNNEHSGLQIMGYQVELYVQNLGEMPESNGIYDLEENDWIKEPNPDDIKSIGLNKFSIKDKAAKIMTIIDDMYNALNATDDSHKIETIGDDAQYLWKKVKAMRKASLESNGESGAGNIVYKILRRTQYLDKLFRLFSVVYDRNNSIIESVESNNNVDVFALAKERFGVTNDIRECGYILPDGSMLDFSGRHMVAGNTDTSHLRSRRGVDHRDIGGLNWDANMTTKSGLNINMADFIRMGAIRIHCSNTWSSINLFKKPTREQVNPMLRLIQYSNGNVTVEIGDGDNSYEYAEWNEANSRRVVNDIIRYFDGETINLVGNVTESKVYDKSNSITESKGKKKKYTVYINGKKDDTFSDMNWKRKPKVGNGFYCGGAVFKIKKVTDDSIYAIEESKNTSAQLLNEWDKIDYFEKAKQYFGTTNDLNECGFILPNGEMLDLSSVKGRRGIPHRNVEAIGVGLETFIEHGAIRCDSRYKLINICKKPTKEQINRLTQIIKANDGSVSLDLGNGHVTFDYVDYKNANYKRIINDILNFFDNKVKPSSLYVRESIEKYAHVITLLKEEVVADGNSEHNPYEKRWKAERKALKNFICNFGKVMTSRENGKQYKVYYDKVLSQLIGYNYCICLQWDPIQLKPSSTLYIRALDKFTNKIFQAQYDQRGKDNMLGTSDDLRYGNQQQNNYQYQ